ncbi:MAG: hypothetical protein DWQ04_20880 [Chloroflexi bacterium]|nr:MAG: hypothetical protein DWQ04_20880 [Chloroflexota bacterium]
MITRLLSKKWILMMAVGLIGLAGFLAMPSAEVHAQDNTPGENLNDLLSRGLTRLQTASTNLQNRLDKTADIFTRGEEWIAKLQADGVDTAVLETALATYKEQVATSQELADAAAQILDEHAGFDDDGNVTDRQEAANTLRQAGRNLRDSHRTLRDATIDLRRTVNDFRREHRGS